MIYYECYKLYNCQVKCTLKANSLSSYHTLRLVIQVSSNERKCHHSPSFSHLFSFQLFHMLDIFHLLESNISTLLLGDLLVCSHFLAVCRTKSSDYRDWSSLISILYFWWMIRYSIHSKLESFQLKRNTNLIRGRQNTIWRNLLELWLAQISKYFL